MLCTGCASFCAHFRLYFTKNGHIKICTFFSAALMLRRWVCALVSDVSTSLSLGFFLPNYFGAMVVCFQLDLRERAAFGPVCDSQPLSLWTGPRCWVSLQSEPQCWSAWATALLPGCLLPGCPTVRLSPRLLIGFEMETISSVPEVVCCVVGFCRSV